MAQREGLTYLYLFIVALLLFVLMTVAFLLEFNKRKDLAGKHQRLERSLEEAKENQKQMFALANRLQELIAGPRSLGAQEATDTTFEEKVNTLIAQVRSEHLGRVLKAVNTARADLGQSQIDAYTYLVEPYGHSEQVFQAYATRHDDLDQKNLTERTSFLEKLKSLEAERTAGAEALSNARTEIADLENALETCRTEHNTAIARMTQDLSDKEEEWTNERLLLRRQLQSKDNDLATMGILVKQLQEKDKRSRTLDDAEPDGQLVDVSSQLGKGWIDLGRKNHLQRGLIFRVYQTLKGGKKLYKGRVEVRKVDEDFAEVAIIEDLNPDRNPITAGDRITSPFYDAAEKPIFVFAGPRLSTQEMTLDFLRSKLNSYGVEVKGSVDIHTSFLVALQDYEKTIEYQNAERLGIPILREEELIQFIGY